MTKPLLVLAALTLYCCIVIMPAFARDGCQCIRYSTNPVPRRVIRKVEVIPSSGHCRRPEVIIITRRGQVICTKPGLKWVDNMISELQREASNKPTPPPTTSTTHEVPV